MKKQDSGKGDEQALARQQKLVCALQSATVFEHPAASIELHETHISWVVLAGEFAYKIKKSVDFGFLDFSTLEKRHFYCQEELRLNRRFAAQLYLAVVYFSGSVTKPLLNGSGEPLEYAVKMRRFPQDCLLVSLAVERRLTCDHIDEIARVLANIHAKVDRATADSDFGRPEDIHRWVMENFHHIRSAMQPQCQDPGLAALDSWCQQEFSDIRGCLEQRRRDGYVRECHGDLHLGNLALIDGRITPFDCIEFNPQLRWIDVMSEAAFLMMDLLDRGYAGMAYRFLNAYLQDTGDYAGLRVLRYYLVYRALVRAKVAMLRYAQSTASPQDRAEAWHDYAGYARLAADWAVSPCPFMVIMHGVSGSGKSWCASRLAEKLGAVLLRSDVERKRLFGLQADAKTGAGLQAGIYSQAASERTYARLADMAAAVIDCGLAVIVDAAFLRQAERQHFRRLADTLGVCFVMVHMEADEATLRERITSRSKTGIDPSEAGIAVMKAQLATQEPLSAGEMHYVLRIEDTSVHGLDALLNSIQRRCSAPAGTE